MTFKQNRRQKLEASGKMLLPFVFLLPLLLAIFAAPPQSPFSIDDDNSIFAAESAFSSDRSLLPGVQVFPRAQPPFSPGNGFLSQRSLLGRGNSALDLETWTKGQAMRANQENAVVAQLAQMAPQRRNQLVRDVANGNASAANELVTRLLRDLAASQHGQVAFPQLAGMDRQMSPLLGMDPAALGAMAGAVPSSQLSNSLLSLQNGGGGGGFNGFPFPLQMQLLQQQQQQQQRQQQLLGASGNSQQRMLMQLANGSPNNPNNNFMMPNAAALLMASQSGNGQFGNNAAQQMLSERLLREQQQQQLFPARPSSGPFASSSSGFSSSSSAGNTNDFSELSRPPASPFGGIGSSTSTQMAPFSQIGGRGSGGREFGRTLSEAGLMSNGNGGGNGFLRAFDDTATDAGNIGVFSLPGGRGFVDPLMLDSEKLIEEAIGRNNAVGGGMVRREEPKVGGSRKSTGSGLRRQKKS